MRPIFNELDLHFMYEQIDILMNCFGKVFTLMPYEEIQSKKVNRSSAVSTKLINHLDPELNEIGRKRNKLGGISLYNESYLRKISPRQEFQQNKDTQDIES